MNKEQIKRLFRFSNSGRGAYLINSDEHYIDDVIDKIIIEIKLYTAELEAKVYTYEKIIENSNFKAVLNQTKESMQKKISELEGELEILKGEENVKEDKTNI